MALHSLTLFGALFATLGCTKDAAEDSADTATGPEAVCTELAEVECVDELILGLGLQDAESDGEVSTVTDGDDFVSTIDATAGGYEASSKNPWVYVRFTADGLEKVVIDDEEALESMEWHMALHRFKIRINSGSSGPSCVGAAPLLETAYADITEPGDPTYYYDEYMDGSCEVIYDSSGLPGSPQLAMGSWWSYESCVKTTGNPFIIQLEDGHVLKLVVEAYYESGQEACNESGTAGTNSAIFTMRWQMLE